MILRTALRKAGIGWSSGGVITDDRGAQNVGDCRDAQWYRAATATATATAGAPWRVLTAVAGVLRGRPAARAALPNVIDIVFDGYLSHMI
ncbi:hypothetical protein [Nocardia sp. NBC_00403]|uniref:hypothetical protein n=1 Tax=Nocardia sp. NBC_00403 TaxID=2975990 RepID=UPI002E1BD012